MSGFRAFGLATDIQPPPPVKAVSAIRAKDDTRHADVSWPASAGAQFYILRYGARVGGDVQPRPHAYQVYSPNATLTYPLYALSVGVRYSVVIDAVNEAGVTPGVDVAVV